MMSKAWSHYVADMSAHTASIVFDDGISKVIKGLPETTSVLVTADLQEMNEDRMPTDAEAERLSQLGAALDKVFGEKDGYSVGRVTSNGQRHHFYYLTEMSDEVSAALRKEGQNLGYELSGGATHDPDKSAYFEHLYPDPESRQVVSDMAVIRLLVENGDDISVPRRVDHVSVFSNKDAATAYANWASNAGYDVDPVRKSGSFFKRSFEVESHSQTAVTVYAINPHSLGHFRKAKEFGGYYDGWGCTIVPNGDVSP